MSEKVIGYFLLVAGLLITAYTAFDVFLVFTKAKPPVQLFNFEGISIDPAAYAPQFEVPENMGSPVKRGSAQEVEIIPADMLNITSNLFAHILLMGFIANVGTRIATLGSTLIRTIEVKVNTKTSSTEAAS